MSQPAAESPIRAALYPRISNDDRGDEAGVDRQLERLLAEAGRRGWDHIAFVENDRSATRGKPRPEYTNLLAAIRAGEVQAVLVTANDRLHRNVDEENAFIREFQDSGLRVVSLADGEWNLANAAGRGNVRMRGVWAQMEAEQIADRVRDKHAALAEAGKHHGGKRPFGYGPIVLDGYGNPIMLESVRRDPATREKLRVQVPKRDWEALVPEEAMLIREAAGRVLAGESAWKVCADWQARGVLTAGGKPWKTAVLRQVLSSPRIAGFRSHKGQLHPAAWPSIVEVEVWEQVKALLQYRKLRARPARYLLTGFVRCGVCGQTLNGRKATDGRYRYVCAKGVERPDCCGKLARDRDRVDRYVTGLVLANLSLENRDPEPPNPELVAMDALLQRLEDDYADGVWNRDQYDRQLARLQERRAKVVERITEALGSEIEAEPGWLAVGPDAWWRRAKLEERRGLLEREQVRVVVLPVGRGQAARWVEADTIRVWMAGVELTGDLADEGTEVTAA